MIITRQAALRAALIVVTFVAICCDNGAPERGPRNTAASNTNANANSAGNVTPSPTPAAIAESRTAANEWAVTLPVVDAFLADERFAKELKSHLQLTDSQIDRLKSVSQRSTARLRQEGRESRDNEIDRTDLRQQTESEIAQVIGPEKTKQLFSFVADRWTGEADGGTIALTAPSAVPTDTRIVVNDPAFRMDVFENGQLIKSYMVGIGYPEFPLPTGLRKADTIIFNPTWTPPDEPWVENFGGKARPGETIKAGDRKNPLGLLKIPIGLPSLVHGGKRPAKIGNFASHGCVGLTDSQAKDFAKLLARLSGTELTDEQIARFGKKRTETKTIKLNNPVPVELRYETITVEGGKLHVYRDVYVRGTNTEQNLRAVLNAYGVSLEQLNEDERQQVMAALEQMSRDPSGRKSDVARSAAARATRSSVGAVTRIIKGQKEVVIEIAALSGKGYPAPVALDTGGARPAPSVRTSRKRR